MNNNKPIFATSAKKEIDDVKHVLTYVNPECVSLFSPKTEGFHGSKTLWESVKGYEAYWEALLPFLLRTTELP